MTGGDPEEGSDAATADTAPGSRSPTSSARPSPRDGPLSSTAASRSSARIATIAVLRVRGLPVKGYASHGESWSVALSLRLASAELLRADSRLGDPVLILDDVFAELDADRRARLAELVARLRAGHRDGRGGGGRARAAARAGRPRRGRAHPRGRGCLT